MYIFNDDVPLSKVDTTIIKRKKDKYSHLKVFDLKKKEISRHIQVLLLNSKLISN